MEQIYDKCCGVDVHKKLIVACFKRSQCDSCQRAAYESGYVAVAHSMLIAIYHILRYGVPFHDLGSDYYNQFNRERKINAYLKKLKALGWETPVAMAVQPI